MKKLSYGKHNIDQTDINLVKKSLSSDMITGGSYLNKFEKKIKSFTKSKFSLACNSGTAAIHLSLLAIGIKKNDNVFKFELLNRIYNTKFGLRILYFI